MSAPIRLPLALLTAFTPLVTLGASSGVTQAKPADAVPLEDATMIIELNSTDLDVGIQLFLDGEGWQSLEVSSPAGAEMFEVESHGKLTRQGGGSELFVESAEPTLDELPLPVFFNRFPEGTYTVRGITTDGERIFAQAEFTHVLPAGPVLVTPVPKNGEECATDVAIPTPIAWEPVTTTYFGSPLEVVQYEVIIEGEDSTFDVHIPASAGTQITVPAEVLHPGTEYSYEVLAIEEGGNQTITETCFVTAE